ncbi:MAG: helix-turn-helix domain-containing protein [Victivallales bacterium]
MESEIDVNTEARHRSCDLRVHVDSFAARLAANRVRDGFDPVNLRLELTELKRAAMALDYSAFHKRDWAVHREICIMADVPKLLEVWQVLADEHEMFSIKTLRKCWPDLKSLADAHEALVEAVVSGDAYVAGEAAARHIDAIWYRLAELGQLESPRKEPLLSATAYVAFHFDKHVTLNWLSKNVAFTSAGNLSRLFRNTHGVSFKGYLQQIRMRKAADMLEHSRLPVRIIASRTGYDDPSRFSEHFQRFTGITPLCYRKQITANPHRFPKPNIPRIARGELSGDAPFQSRIK